MIYYLLRRLPENVMGGSKFDDAQPVALFRINTPKNNNNLRLVDLRLNNRFGWMITVSMGSISAYNILLDNENEVIETLRDNSFFIDEITKSEWESWDAMELFPRLKISVFR
jgi:hypothetical protein